MSTNTNTKKRKILTIETKRQILDDVDKRNMTKKDIAAKYNIPHNSLSTIIKNRDKITMTRYEPHRKKPRVMVNSEVDGSSMVQADKSRQCPNIWTNHTREGETDR